MADARTTRRIAAALPEAQDLSTPSALRFEVRGKAFAWSWQERVEPKKPRRPRLDVLAVRCAPEEKEAILSSAPDTFFVDDHYRGFPAVLVRLGTIGEDALAALLKAAWRCQAPPALAKTAITERRS